jgi:hypothetical protein
MLLLFQLASPKAVALLTELFQCMNLYVTNQFLTTIFFLSSFYQVVFPELFKVHNMHIQWNHDFYDI